MYSIKITGSLKNLTWSSGHFVPSNVKCRNLHGHDYSLDIILNNLELKDNGMTIDFTIIKAIIKPLIEKMDHKFIVPGINLKKKNNDFYDIYVNNEFKATMKKDEIFVFKYPVGSAEYIAKYFYDEILDGLKKIDNDFNMEIVVHEGPGNIAIYSR